MDGLITAHTFKMIEAGCAPGSGRYGLQVDVPDDISPVFPYLNALLKSSQYDHEARILIWREGEQGYAMRPHEIRIVQTGGIDDMAQAQALVDAIVSRVNDVWRDREGITPRLAGSEPPHAMAIFWLLPKGGCARECGYATCLAFATDLREGKTELERCPELLKPQHSANRQKLAAMLPQ